MSARQSGFTLIELMISLVIASIAIAATFALGFSLNNTHREHRTMAVVERSARGSLEVISTALRSASPGVTTGVIDDLVACNGSDAIQVINSSVGPDELRVIYAAGGVVGTLLNDTTDPTVTPITTLDVT